jgi:acyl-homoserine lactone acylase PvdQ
LPAPGWSGANEWDGWRTLDALPHALDPRGAAAPRPTTTTASALAAMARMHPDRADALLRKLQAARLADSLAVQRALIVAALAESMLESRDAGALVQQVLFAHPLAITAAARRRFNVGPIAPADDAGPSFALSFDTASWDRSTAMNAPGQSGSPDSAHFDDFARRWAAGERVELPFSDAAVQASAASTLTLTVRTP